MASSESLDKDKSVIETLREHCERKDGYLIVDKNYLQGILKDKGYRPIRGMIHGTDLLNKENQEQ